MKSIKVNALFVEWGKFSIFAYTIKYKQTGYGTSEK